MSCTLKARFACNCHCSKSASIGIITVILCVCCRRWLVSHAVILLSRLSANFHFSTVLNCNVSTVCFFNVLLVYSALMYDVLMIDMFCTILSTDEMSYSCPYFPTAFRPLLIPVPLRVGVWVVIGSWFSTEVICPPEDKVNLHSTNLVQCGVNLLICPMLLLLHCWFHGNWIAFLWPNVSVQQWCWWGSKLACCESDAIMLSCWYL